MQCVKPKESLEYFRAFCKRLVRFCVIKMQSIAIYRWIARSFQSGIRIKEADERDLKAFYTWYRPSKVEVSVSQDSRSTDFVAQKGSMVIGFAQLVRHSENTDFYEGYWLFGLVVKTRYRGMRIGEKLSQAVIERAKEEGANEILLLVRDNNRPAIDLYHKLGFRIEVVPDLEEQLSGSLKAVEQILHSHPTQSESAKGFRRQVA